MVDAEAAALADAIVSAPSWPARVPLACLRGPFVLDPMADGRDDDMDLDMDLTGESVRRAATLRCG